MPDPYTATLQDALFIGLAPWVGHMAFHATLDLRTPKRLEDLIAAAEATIRQLPVLGCRYAPGMIRDRWEPLDTPLEDSTVVVDDDPDLDAATRRWVNAPIDPLVARPWRLTLLTGGDGPGCRIVASLLHVAVDGGGAMAIAQALGANLYGTETIVPVEPRRDMGLIFEALSGLQTAALVTAAVGELLQGLELLSIAPLRGAQQRNADDPPAPPPRWRTLRIDAPTLARIKATCAQHNATVNDALTSALARAAGQRSGGRGAMAVIYTVDLRRYIQPPRLVASNLSGLRLLTLPTPLRDAPQEALRATAANSRATRNFRGVFFALLPMLTNATTPAAAFRAWAEHQGPVLTRWMLSRALVVTNVGRLDAGLTCFGDDLEDLSIIGPCNANLPHPTCAAWGLRGRLNLHLFAGGHLPHAALDDLADDYQHALDALAAPAR